MEDKSPEQDGAGVGDNIPDPAPWHLYIVRTRQNALYTGITTDVQRRLKEHRHSALRGARYLRGKGPLELVFSVCVGGRGEALRLEYQIKQLPRARKEALVAGKLPLPRLQELLPDCITAKL